MSLSAIVLAAGKGTRMESDDAKVLHDVAGRPLVAWVLDALEAVDPDRVVVVVGYQADQVAGILPEGVETAFQAQQHGTGHATEIGLAALPTGAGDLVLVVPGDMPLLQAETIDALVASHRRAGNAATLLTADLEDPSGYGRVVRSAGGVEAIIEHRDASPQQLEIREVNTSVYVFDAAALRDALKRVGADNDQAERYLTDVIGIMRSEGLKIGAMVVEAGEGMGVNDDIQLAAAADAIREREGS